MSVSQLRLRSKKSTGVPSRLDEGTATLQHHCQFCRYRVECTRMEKTPTRNA
ncbi:hypothetical protein A2U01_0106449 [Trifolium medium]|uniref:Uncharacterized protein n=1 Tax=Trifolium medium TaxID=97028 RepID=A0A392VFL2_9FABA|nr:hypothetical protein [Trifolium medium]